MDRLFARRLVVLALALLLTSSDWAFAQYGPGGFGGRRGFGRRNRDMGQFNNPNTPPVTNPATDKPKEEKKDEKSAEPKKEEGPPPVTRPRASDNSASLAEQQMTVDPKRMVSFNFQEAPWTFVVEELARVSGATLDWTQLPGDSFNMRSNKKYSLAEARDLINEHLLARGYAILFDAKNNQMKVVSLDDLNTALVPRVAPEDLDGLPPHDLVKVTFRLEWMLAKDAVDEFKQVLSPKAKLLPMKTTNRLEAIDSVVNLKQLASLIDEEQGRGGLNRLAQEFELRYTRAPEVVEQLELFLGLKKPGENGMANASPMQQMMMQRMQMMAAQQGQQQGQQAAAMQVPAEIHLMANARRNTVIVNAPPDKMGIIKSAIWKIDVPSDRPSLSDDKTLMHPYRLTTVDPDVVVSFLQTVADLDPQTKLDVDKKTHTIIAYASAKDQKVIAALIKNLDNADRQLKVIQLRKLDADLVAGTIRMLMVGPDDTKNSNNNNGYGGGRRFGFWSAMNAANNEDQPTSKFRVEADIVDNRLLVFADAVELDKVYKCLAEMGEVSAHEHGVDTMRVLDLGAGDDQKVLLERLKKAWPTLGKDGNKLIIDVPPEKKRAPAQDESKPEQSAPKAPATAPSTVPSADKNQKAPNPPVGKAERSASLRPASHVQFVDLKQVVAPADPTTADVGDTNTKTGNSVSAPAASETAPAPRDVRHGRKRMQNRRLQQVQAPPAEDVSPADKIAQPETKSGAGAPIFITRGQDGKLVFSSRDTEALDQIEEMAGRLAPHRKDYAVYYLKHADAYSVKLNLDDFFQTEKKDNNEDKFRRWWWDDDSSNKKDDSPMLSRRKPMRFIVDGQTNSILVQGGTADQLRQINELIDMYDSPAPVSVRPARLTQLFHIQHNKASVIADVIKDVFRDLLSTKDKAMESFNQTKAQGRSGGRGYISYDFGEKEDDGKMSQARFNGALSLGIDDTTNTLLVSAANQTLMIAVSEIIHDLDKAAVQAAQSFQVLQINRSIDANALQKKLTDMLKKTAPGPAVGQQPEKSPQNQGQRRGRGGRNSGGGGGGGNESTND